MFRLETFGGLALTDVSRSPVPTPRLRLALLALLAVGGPRGVTRDKLIAYLWPERPADNARHSLEQLLYALRRQLSEELVVGSDPIRLNLAVIGTDVGEFEQALAQGTPAEAVARYRGPFLDGFFLSDAPEFEQWVETERSRLAAEHARALHRLAKEAAEQGQHTAEIEWWRQLAALDPLSERSAAGVVRALVAAGDWAAALQHARAYEARMRQELPGEPVQLTALVERLRAERGAPLPPPLSRERYAIVRELGKGRMATVYLARDRKLDRPVALKLLRPELAASTEADRLLREIAILAQMHHPHILQVHDSGLMEVGDGRALPYYVMPYVSGESLRERLVREGELSLEEVVRLAGEVANALAYAHARRIVHRDVKPENILLESGHALVADFGIAHALDAAGGEQLSRSGVTLGTPGYMSPEQIAGAPGLDGRADVYGLGCVAYELLAGSPPFTGATTPALLARHVADPVPPIRTVRPAVPPALERTVLRALSKHPQDRHSGAEEFGLELRRALP